MPFIEKMPVWFGVCFNTPSHHRVHRGVNPKYIDKNPAVLLLFMIECLVHSKRGRKSILRHYSRQLKSWNIIVANFDFTMAGL